MDNLDNISCPFCAGRLRPVKEVDKNNLIIACDCSQYPVVDGIPVLVGDSIDGTIYSKSRVIDALDKGDKDTALACLISKQVVDTEFLSLLKGVPCCSKVYARLKSRLQSHRNEAMRSFIAADSNDRTFRDFLSFYFGDKEGKQKNIFNYYYYKHGDPRYFVGKMLTPFYSSLSGAPVLDIGCGTGQLTRELAASLPTPSPIYAIDINFLCAYVAKKFVYKAANYIVCDVNNGLPFQDSYFGGIFCSNTLHFVRNVKLLFQEISRVNKHEAVMIFASVRHAKQKHSVWNFATSVAQYKKLIGDKSCYVVPDDHLVDTYFDDGYKLDFNISNSLAELEKYGLLTFISGDVSKLSKSRVASSGIDGNARLRLNPLFQPSSEQDNTLIRLTPSEYFERENYKLAEYFPRTLSVSDGFFDDLKHQRISQEIVDLYRRGVLVDLPSNYC